MSQQDRVRSGTEAAYPAAERVTSRRATVPESVLVYPALIGLPLLVLAPRIASLPAELLFSIRPFCRYATETQLVSLLILTMLLAYHSYYLKYGSTNPLKRIKEHETPLKDLMGGVWPVGVFLAAIAVMVLVDDVFAQFAFSKPGLSGMDESGLIGLVKYTLREALFGPDSSLNSRMPSGFALRQWIFFLTAWLIMLQGPFSRTVAKWVTGAYFLVFLYVAAARVSVGAHLPVDIAVSVSIGTLLFMFALGALAVVRKTGQATSILEYFVAYGFVSVVVFILLSNNPMFWVAAVAVSGAVAALLSQRVSQDRQEES